MDFEGTEKPPREPPRIDRIEEAMTKGEEGRRDKQRDKMQNIPVNLSGVRKWTKG
jgi:hypothetical protein